MTTTQTLFNGMFAALALTGALMAAGPASAGLSARVDTVASSEITGATQNVAETTVTAELNAADKVDAKERSPRHDSDVTARRHIQAKPAASRSVERTENRKPRYTWHAVSYARMSPVGLGLNCHRR
jgi:hypothetical protein